MLFMSYRLRTSICLIITLLYCCSAVAEITAEDYSLLSTVLSHGFGDSCQEIAIEERTSAGSVALSSETRPAAEVAEILGIDQQLLTAWENANVDFDYFAERFKLTCSYQILSAQKLADIFDNTADGSPETGWRNFRKALPHLVGIMRLGKPVIDHQSNRALAYVEFDCGPTCGSGRFVSLSKDPDNRWQVSGGSLVWMASE
jgi:hypothetical protein